MLFVGDGTGPESLNALRQAIRAARAAGARMSVLDVVADLQTVTMRNSGRTRQRSARNS